MILKKNSLKILMSFMLAISSISLPIYTAHATLPLNAKTANLAAIVEKVAPAVVNIDTKGHRVRRDWFYGDITRQFSGLGSGVIINAEKGYIVTNHHVIDKADTIRVTLSNGKVFDAEILGRDAESDIALLQIKAKNLTALRFANSNQAKIGDYVIAIGNPFGLGQSVTAGIISALGRSPSRTGANTYSAFIQTDAAINQGNSGGALINLQAELVGINSAIFGSRNGGGNIGIGFAIPSNIVKNITSQIAKHGKARRGMLGITGNSLTADLAEQLNISISNGGIWVNEVIPNSAAEKAGIMVNDVIVSIDNVAISNFDELRAKIATAGVGAKVKLGIIRVYGNTAQKQKRLSLSATLQGVTDQARQLGGEVHVLLAGATLGSANKKGILVLEVQANSNADRLVGLKAGDIITRVNRQQVKNQSELESAIKDASKANKGLLLEFKRKDGSYAGRFFEGQR